MTKLSKINDDQMTVAFGIMDRNPDFGYELNLTENPADYDFDPVSFLEAGYTYYYQDPGDPDMYFFFTAKEYRKLGL